MENFERLRNQAAKNAKPTRIKVVRVARSSTLKQIDCPKDVAETLASRSNYPTIPLLKGLLYAPTVTNEGRLIIKPGYDYDACILFTISSLSSVSLTNFLANVSLS